MVHLDSNYFKGDIKILNPADDGDRLSYQTIKINITRPVFKNIVTHSNPGILAVLAVD